MIVLFLTANTKLTFSVQRMFMLVTHMKCPNDMKTSRHFSQERIVLCKYDRTLGNLKCLEGKDIVEVT